MNAMMELCISTLTQGFIYALLSYGVYITYKILDFPDLTVDGSFPLGAAVTAVMLVKGVNPFVTLLAALFIGVVVAIFALKKYFKRPLDDILTEAAGQAGMVLLITGAGGSFGAIINATGIGDYIVNIMSNFNVPLIILGFVLSQILRAAQGSATVALVTTSAIVAPSIASMGASPVLVGLAICFGSVGLSLPNDSGFWVINRFAGFSLPDTIKGWTVNGFVAGLAGLVVVLIMSFFNLPGLY